MKLYVSYQVIEHFDDGPPEPFGNYVSDHQPEVGEIIQLRWLDGSVANRARVIEVRNDFELHVAHVSK